MGETTWCQHTYALNTETYAIVKFWTNDTITYEVGLTSILCDLDVDDDNFYEVKGVVIESLIPTYFWSLGEPNL